MVGLMFDNTQWKDRIGYYYDVDNLSSPISTDLQGHQNQLKTNRSLFRLPSCI